jgi:hypothetical protein
VSQIYDSTCVLLAIFESFPAFIPILRIGGNEVAWNFSRGYMSLNEVEREIAIYRTIAKNYMDDRFPQNFFRFGKIFGLKTKMAEQS